jgi:hypothetical protein
MRHARQTKKDGVFAVLFTACGCLLFISPEILLTFKGIPIILLKERIIFKLTPDPQDVPLEEKLVKILVIGKEGIEDRPILRFNPVHYNHLVTCERIVVHDERHADQH